ncbi:carbon monoxide dehydrogenase subunit G [Limibaculum sp. FT325]|uniref:CoxG family protein n=1 Tax=Thermohalobaculum sediminis TaxID=2939436 RepID=UPI0020BF6177|nr:carbon monoxide dehydrogenase subunit G [Limibaculum sediminis]MCL5778045.1 carbon monoxide dehydrogenase subunit G [Limibaculum sediminis]
MNMSGERLIAAPRADVWAALNDPEVLKACIPGCDSLEKTSDTSFSAVATQKVGPVKATFKGEVNLSDIAEGEGYTITGEGKGGAAGFAKGGAKVRLSDAEPPEGKAGPATLLSYEAEAKVGGKLAQLGSRLIDGFAKKMADDFFNRFQTAIEGPAEPEEAGEASADAPAAEKKKSWLKRLVG